MREKGLWKQKLLFVKRYLKSLIGIHNRMIMMMRQDQMRKVKKDDEDEK